MTQLTEYEKHLIRSKQLRQKIDEVRKKLEDSGAIYKRNKKKDEEGSNQV